MATKLWLHFGFKDVTYSHKNLYCVNLAIKSYLKK